MKNFTQIKSVLVTITLLIFVLLINIGVQNSDSETEIEVTAQNIINAQADEKFNSDVPKTEEMKSWGFSFTEFNPTTGTIRNTVYRNGTVHTSIDLIDSENFLLGQKN